jgi:glutamate-5-semialdehyde dehydrogenase
MLSENYSDADYVLGLANVARVAARRLSATDDSTRQAILSAMADALESAKSSVTTANQLDLEAGRQAGMSSAMLDRLELTESRFRSMVDGLRQVAGLADPLNRVLSESRREDGLLIKKISVPIGVIAMIFESRPNVTADAAALCIRSGNAVILRGGREAIKSNTAIAQALQTGGQKAGLPVGAVQLIETTSREAVKHLVQLEGKIDLVIPRGGEGLIRAVTEQARVPVIKHYKGVCHVYVDKDAELEMALQIIENAKVQRPGVCNAAETLLVDQAIANKFLPLAAERLGAKGVELRGDSQARAIVSSMTPAIEDDWYAEYLDLILSVRVVNGVEQAIEHISQYGSAHSDAIVTANQSTAERFLREVDSAAVYWNASTRFTDGGEFGLGAEIGISTDKLHARGPMGLAELTTYKYLVTGSGQIRK